MAQPPTNWILTVPTPGDPDYTELAGDHILSPIVLDATSWTSNNSIVPFWQIRPSGANLLLRGFTVAGQSVTFTLTSGLWSFLTDNTFPLTSSTAGWTTPTTLTAIRSRAETDIYHSPADIIRYLLVSFSVGTLPTSQSPFWPISTGQELPDPDNAITTYDTVGNIDGEVNISHEIYEHYGFQVRVRCNSHTVGWRKTKGIRELLSKTVYNNTVTIGSSSYRVWCVTRLGSIMSLGKDVTNTSRLLFTLNGTVVLTQNP